MLELIETNPAFCRSIATHQREFRAFLFQIQMDQTNEGNKDTIGSVILALKDIHTIFEDVILKGDSLIQEENKKKKDKV